MSKKKADNAEERRRNGEVEEEEEEDEGKNDLEAWERAYADDRSWESLQEDDSGFLRPIARTFCTMISIAAISGGSLPLLESRKGSFATSISLSIYPSPGGCISDTHYGKNPGFSREWGSNGWLQHYNLIKTGEMDFKPSRMAAVAKYAEAFIREFFNQNPLSHIGLITIKDGVSQCLTDLGGKS
ncbi:hypothetical protein GIB67_018785 [Kingdonia uniflora]|uniref:Ssl1-like domain-containing protein n=1 Tax=Kingdonia uniflora TaxID=39325 RepID=A0A7J7NDN1_9MAGN|nr:hypothetical protein GIB67_018785 [Kingdonia uniflora]